MLSRPDNRDREQIQERTPEPLAQIDRRGDRAQFGADMQPTEERVDPGKVRQFLLAEFDRYASDKIADRIDSAGCLYLRCLVHVLPRRYAPSKNRRPLADSNRINSSPRSRAHGNASSLQLDR